jgi:hypothetical protein
MLRFERSNSIAVIFYEKSKVLVPPLEIPKEYQFSTETSEETALRLAGQVGINASVYHGLVVDREVGDAPDYLYLLRPVHNELDESEFLVPIPKLNTVIDRYSSLSDLDKSLMKSVVRHFDRRNQA